MFSGIVEAMGTVRLLRDRDHLRDIEIQVPEFAHELAIGDSVSVDGACLTVATLIPEGFRVEAVGTTLSRTVAGGYVEGSRVNLERALAMGGRLDGHLVQGHVDGVGELLHARREGDYHLLDFRIPEGICRQTILHGSISLNGVSLTVNELQDPDRVQVAIIPHTWEVTNLGRLEPGDRVNVEGDLIGKYVGRWMAAESTTPAGADGS